MIEVELIYDKDCPNVTGARANLLRAFVEVGLPPKWTEWERSAPEVPSRVREVASPTVLVNGRDVADPQSIQGQASCRLYRSADGRSSGVPPLELLAASLARAKSQKWPALHVPLRSGLTTVPGIVAVLLPNVACPACWPAYAGVLSTLGLGFLMSSKYLFPVTAVLLLATLWSLGLRARNRRGYLPLVLGSTAAITLLVGKFVLESPVAIYGGIALLVAASLWNSWPIRSDSNRCSHCNSETATP